MPRLPPVPISPQTRLRARFCPGVTRSAFTFFQSQSSSSPTSWTRPVMVPCPISERATRITQVLSGCTTTQALTSLPAALCASAAPMPNGKWKPSASPPVAAAEPTTKPRRETFGLDLPDLVEPADILAGILMVMAASLRTCWWREPPRGCHWVDRPRDAPRRECADRCRSGRYWSSPDRCPDRSAWGSS